MKKKKEVVIMGFLSSTAVKIVGSALAAVAATKGADKLIGYLKSRKASGNDEKTAEADVFESAEQAA